MSTDLTTEFREGALAAHEGGERSSCPYYATSNAADAWHAGYVLHAGGDAGGIARATKGRGERINLFPISGDRIVATVRWNDPGADPLPPVTFDVERDWSPAMKACRRVDSERERLELELRARAPLQSKGRAVADAAHLPLFIAADEPSLF